jgi:hypothetical protein
VGRGLHHEYPAGLLGHSYGDHIHAAADEDVDSHAAMDGPFEDFPIFSTALGTAYTIEITGNPFARLKAAAKRIRQRSSVSIP